jgi:signal transduction histidine kinase
VICALSRFKVANGTEAAVRQAFLDRPRLVDSMPGFLGLETYTDARDPSLFYLATRWSDVDSFRAWHRSEAHHQSHRGIPRGLRLDASFTELVVMDRIEGPEPTAEEAVADAAPFLARALADHPGLFLLVANREGRLRLASAAFARSLGVPAAELQRREVWDLLVAGDRDALRSRVEAGTRDAGDPFLLNFVDADQAPFTLACRVDVQPDRFTLLGAPPHKTQEWFQDELVGLANDLAVMTRESRRKSRDLARALADLERTQALLVHREKMASLGQMTAGVAHEINNPIAFVSNNHATLDRDFRDLLAFVGEVRAALPELERVAPALHARLAAADREAQLDYLLEAVPRKLATNVEGLERVKQIVLDMRTFSRLDEAEFKDSDLASDIASTLRFLGPLAREHDVGLETAVDSVPPLHCSPGALNQAVSNVVANAIQASPRGERVLVSLRDEAGEVVIAVEDRGAGIPAEHLSRVFDPFFTTRAAGAGTGLGLSIAHGIVEAHGGRIEIQSEPGHGTKVSIRVPRRSGR